MYGVPELKLYAQALAVVASVPRPSRVAVMDGSAEEATLLLPESHAGIDAGAGQRAMRTFLSFARMVTTLVFGSQSIVPPVTDFGAHAPSLKRSLDAASNFV